MFQFRDWWQFVYPAGGEETYSYNSRESTSPNRSCFVNIFSADEFNELWHYLSAHDLQPWIFEGCQADGAPVGLLAARREYIRLINNRELLVDLSRAYREEDRQYMLTLAHRALELTPSIPSYNSDYAPTVTEAIACNLITRRAPPPASHPRIVFER